MVLNDLLLQPFSSIKKTIAILPQETKDDFIIELTHIIEYQYERSGKFGVKGASISQADYMSTIGRIKKYEIILNILMGYGDIRG